MKNRPIASMAVALGFNDLTQAIGDHVIILSALGLAFTFMV